MDDEQVEEEMSELERDARIAQAAARLGLSPQELRAIIDDMPCGVPKIF